MIEAMPSQSSKLWDDATDEVYAALEFKMVCIEDQFGCLCGVKANCLNAGHFLSQLTEKANCQLIYVQLHGKF